MKITKSQLRQIIKEEIEKFSEVVDIEEAQTYKQAQEEPMPEEEMEKLAALSKADEDAAIERAVQRLMKRKGLSREDAEDEVKKYL